MATLCYSDNLLQSIVNIMFYKSVFHIVLFQIYPTLPKKKNINKTVAIKKEINI